MFFITSNILCFTFLNILGQIQSLVEQPAVENNDIAATEKVIRNTVKNLFTSLNQSLENQKPKIKQFSIVHEFFVSITLQDHDNLNEIARLTKVDKADNNIEIFMTQLNEVLNEDNKSDEATDVVYVTNLIGTFLERLEGLKEIYGLNTNVSIFEINKDVVKHLSRDKNVLHNETKSINETKDTILGNNEFWGSGRRIYQGKRVKISRFPFMASVQFFRKFQCGGSIIKSDLVITSASCLQLAWNNRFFRENPAFLSVQVGCDFYEGGEENIPVQEIYFHPNYNPKNLRHNLALMRLRRILKLGKEVRKVKKIDFDRNAWPLPSNTDGITVIGWGARGTSNIIQNPWSNRLSFAVLEFYPLQECQEVYSKEFVTDRHFCAGFFSKGGGACNRDAGGPGVAHGILLGVVSFGSPVCGAPDAPTVFTKLGYYTDWIEEIMEQDVPKAFHSTSEKPPKFHTVILPFSDLFEQTTLRIKPIDDYVKVGTPPPSIKTVDALRTLDKDKFFKEFISTMFDSHQLEDVINDETAETVTTTTSPVHKFTIKKKHISNIISKPKNETSKETTTNVKPYTTTPSADTSESSESAASEEGTRVTRMDETDMKPNAKQKSKKHKKSRVDENYISSEDKKLENVIVSLIDNIDVEDFLHSKSDEILRYSSQESFGRHKAHLKTKDDGQRNRVDVETTESPAPQFNESSIRELARAMNIDESILTFLYYANKNNNNKNEINNTMKDLLNKKKESYREIFLNVDHKDMQSDSDLQKRIGKDDEAKDRQESDDSDEDNDSDDDRGDDDDDDNDDDDGDDYGNDDNGSGGYEALSIPIPEFRSSPSNSNDTLGIMDIMLSNPDDVYNLISEVVKKKTEQKMAP